MAGTELGVLHHGLGRCHDLGHVFHIRAYDDNDALRLERRQRGHDMGDQRPAGQRMQNLGQVRFHPRSLARSENDDGEVFIRCHALLISGADGGDFRRLSAFSVGRSPPGRLKLPGTTAGRTMPQRPRTRQVTNSYEFFQEFLK